MRQLHHPPNLSKYGLNTKKYQKLIPKSLQYLKEVSLELNQFSIFGKTILDFAILMVEKQLNLIFFVCNFLEMHFHLNWQPTS